MPNDIDNKLSAAKQALAHANSSFPVHSVPTSSLPAATKPAANKSIPSIGDELTAKKSMVEKAVSALPKMHKGGEIKTSGGYQLQAGEHVLTASEAAKARSHALMANGMKSLAKPATAAPMTKRGTASITIEPMPAKPKTFTDKNMEPGFGAGGANNVTTRSAKPSGTIRPEINATPKMKPPTSSVSTT